MTNPGTNTSLILNLLEFIFLALAAVGIYLQILSRSYTEYFSDQAGPQYLSDFYLPHHLAKGSLFFLAFSGIILLADLLIIQPPTLLRGSWTIDVLNALVSLSIIQMIVALFLFGGAVMAGDHELDEENRTIFRAPIVFLFSLFSSESSEGTDRAESG